MATNTKHMTHQSPESNKKEKQKAGEEEEDGISYARDEENDTNEQTTQLPRVKTKTKNAEQHVAMTLQYVER